MQIIKIIDKKQLNDFVGGREHAQFLQSFEWGEFQKEVSGAVWRIGVEEQGKLIASAKLVKKRLPMGRSYFYCGRGPIGITNYDPPAGRAGLRITNYLFEEIERIAKDEGVMFLRFEPNWKLEIRPDECPFGRVGNWKFVKTIDVQPSKTLVLDLSLPEDELLKQMRQKTRYNIRLAEKKGVKITTAGARRFEEFWQLLVSTGDRDEFNLHGRSYYQAMLKLDSDFIKLFFADYRGKPLAANLAVFFGDTATYIHGGSSEENRQAMAPYALQWHNIKLAKQLGYKYYDFHGVDEAKWPGVTRFKMGFGGQVINYPGTFDLVYDASWYNIYKMVRKVRRTF